MQTDVREALLPCPFCGSTDLVRSGDNGYGAFWISCNGCGSATGDFGADTQEKADARWNSRAAAIAASPQVEPVDAADLAQLNGALVRSRDGYVSEAATGLPVLEKWRSETLDWLNAALATVAKLKAASPTPAQAEPVGYVDCGECPRISTGCKGRCTKRAAAPKRTEG